MPDLMDERTEHNLRSGAKWRRLSKMQLKHHPLCQPCLDKGVVTPATISHHVVPVDGDRVRLYWGKLISVCDTCHKGPIAQQEKGRGYATDIGVDGFPTDVEHHPFWRTK
jgi:5-methylcytosine-specific restriction endonuclease McrA